MKLKLSVAYSLIIIGLLLVIIGGGLVLDGMLPTRSKGPNPSPFEIIVGLGLVLLGWLARRSGKAAFKS
jgi:hypothetical protein